MSDKGDCRTAPVTPGLSIRTGRQSPLLEAEVDGTLVEGGYQGMFLKPVSSVLRKSSRLTGSSSCDFQDK